ncbi:DNA polymerase subunit gamma-2, mitochondrial [Condylostylus longicornis]|uniref:DNA polymerase subunit gamma-2, mitochondrial n=1 Tax=Condylostylus longicornis TaxID=2530218 RepID=UPI00244D9BEF|nr:DNA polymerase subunit gamma-2, mitochondrial [Condylostylus longicornis]
MLETLLKSGYIKSEFKTNDVIHLELMPLGSSLFQNIQIEWAKNKTDLNIYTGKSYVSPQQISHSNNEAMNFVKTKYFKENFLFCKEKLQNYFPLAIKTFLTTNQIDINSKISFPHKTFMICDYFFNETQAYEKFSKIQRERKIWWMKHSTDPGRFFLSDLKSDVIQKHKVQTVKIKAKFSFGDIDLESIDVVPLRALLPEDYKEFYLFDKKLNKKCCPVVVHSETCADVGTITLLLDALENSNSNKLSLHRCVSPYQCSICCLLEDEEENRNLEDLAIHLSGVLRKLNIRILNLSKQNSTDYKSLEKELNQVDKLGVPYSLILEYKTLQNGLLKLRNRDTTISEEIHISELTEYLAKIFNYF